MFSVSIAFVGLYAAVNKNIIVPLWFYMTIKTKTIKSLDFKCIPVPMPFAN